MDRLLQVAAITALISVACSPAFKDRRTPSGDFCSDMPIIPAGTEPDREYHRLQPIKSNTDAKTEAERLESLRKVACNTGADAVIEAVNEEVRGDNAQYQMVSSGTAVIWLHRADRGAEGTKPIMALPTPKKAPISADPAPSAEPAPTADPAPSASASAAPAKSGKPAAGKAPKTPSKPTPLKN